jgi:hypothetical protein
MYLAGNADNFFIKSYAMEVVITVGKRACTERRQAFQST